jgi:TonB-linked SusC/RagA family outer membrane protein
MRALSSTCLWSRVARATFIAAITAIPSLTLAQQQQASISGRVMAEGTNEPLSDVRVFLVGSALNVSTNAEGRYSLKNVPTGTMEVRVIRVGFQEQKKSIAITAGAQATLDFTMKQAVVQLQEIVTTATGQQRRSEIGNTIATLGDISKRVEESPVTDIGSLIVGKAPGVIVLPGSMTGTAPTIRIRGVSSLSLSNAPIWVVDGVRFNSSSFTAAGAGGSMVSSSNLNGLNPDEIEDIEIVKGPSAATLYGTDATNGVIVVTTKKGRVGSARWTWFGEGGTIQDKAHYPDTWAIWGHRPAAPTTTVRCLTRELPSGGCIKDSVTELNIIERSDLTPIHTGNRNQYGGQVSGGSETIRYFVSGDLQNETGPIQMPSIEFGRFDSLKVPMRDEWRHPEFLQGQSARANINVSPNPKFDLSVNAGFTKLNQRLAETDNNFNSVFYQAMMSPGFVGAGLGNTGKDPRGQDLHGNNSFTYGDIFQRLAREDVQRLVGTTQASWRPFSWLQNDGTVGLDLASRYSYGLCRFGECPDFSQWRLGQVSDRHRLDRNFSVKLTSNASYQANEWLNLKSTVGADYTNQEGEASTASGTILPPGAASVSQAAVTTGGATLPSADKTLGYYAQEQATFRDRLFVILALRTDQNSAFGANTKAITYPKLSLSWIASDESFFPHYDFLNQFRLRAAYGASGVQPRSTDAFVTYSTPTVSINNVDSPGLRASSLGNSDLKPERTDEFEGGFDTRVLNNRMNIEVTYYSKSTKDALFDVPVPPSSAAQATTIRRNFASVKNAGIEASVTTTLIDRRALGWDMTISGSHNDNKVLKLANDNSGNPILVNGTGANRDSVGFPVRGFFYRTYTFADSNSDGVITANEVVVNPLFSYVGNSIPKDIASITNGFDLLNRTLRINASFDYKGGFMIANGTYSFQCGNNPACPGLSNPDASLEDQAAATAFTGKGTLNTSYGFLQNGQYWRFREISATWTAPATVAQKLRASSASVTFGGRNLHVWTKYKGADPEENFSTGDVQSTFASSAPRRYYTVRLNLHY